MRSPSLFSPVKQSRYEKSNSTNGFLTFQATKPLNVNQLADYRKDVRSNATSREPFTTHQEKHSSIFASWTKPDRSAQEPPKPSRKSPKKNQRLLGGLNYEEIFTNSRIPQSKNKQQLTVDQLFKRQSDTSFENTFAAFPKPQRQNTMGSGYKESPQKAQQKMDRFKNWDDRLDVQLILQNKSISTKISPLGDKPGFYKYVNEAQKGLFDNTSNFLSAKTSKPSLFDNQKQTFSFKDNIPQPKQQTFQRSISPQVANRYVEKFPLTDIVRMTAHFSQLSTQEVTTIPKGYVSELNNLQEILQRVVKRSNYVS